MDHFRGITFAIISNGQALNLYDEFDTPENEDGRSRSRYVEAVAGSTFQVKVNLTPDFEIRTMKAEHAVNVRVRIDGRHDSSLVDHKSKKDLQRKFSNGLFAGFAFTGPRQFCKETREWMWSDYSFGNLVLSIPFPHLNSIPIQSDNMSRREFGPWIFRSKSSGPWENTSHYTTRENGAAPSAVCPQEEIYPNNERTSRESVERAAH